MMDAVSIRPNCFSPARDPPFPESCDLVPKTGFVYTIGPREQDLRGMRQFVAPFLGGRKGSQPLGRQVKMGS